MNQIKSKYIYAVLLLLVIMFSVGTVYRINASTTSMLSKQTGMYKYVVSYTDIVNATSVDGDNSYKRLVVKTIEPANDILSVVNKVKTIFQEPTNNAIDVVNIHVEDASGNWISTGDLGFVPVSLNQAGTYLENRPGDADENGFYSENNQTFLVYYIRCSYNCNLNDLSAGELDVYMLRAGTYTP